MEQNLQTMEAQHRLALWTQRVSDCRSSGQSVQTWCTENNVNYKTYYYWQKKIFGLTKIAHETQFVQLPSKPKAETQRPIANITAGGASIEIYTGADEATLIALLRAIEKC